MNRGQSNYEKELASVTYFKEFFATRWRERFHDVLEVRTWSPALEFKSKFKGAPIEKLYALRNSDLVNSAVRYATLMDIDTVAVGSTEDDALDDNRPDYWDAKNLEIQRGIDNPKFNLVVPYQALHWRKAEVVKWASGCSFPTEKTWSCWRSGDLHCGECEACVSRRNAFANANVNDRTRYAEPLPIA